MVQATLDLNDRLAGLEIISIRYEGTRKEDHIVLRLALTIQFLSNLVCMVDYFEFAAVIRYMINRTNKTYPFFKDPKVMAHLLDWVG